MANMRDIERIRENYITLSNAIAPQITDLVDCLYAKGTITQYTKAAISESHDPNYKKARMLLDIISNKGHIAVQDLYAVVKTQELFVAADILQPQNAPHHLHQNNEVICKTEEIEPSNESFPDSWQSENDIFNAYIKVCMANEARTDMVPCTNLVTRRNTTTNPGCQALADYIAKSAYKYKLGQPKPKVNNNAGKTQNQLDQKQSKFIMAGNFDFFPGLYERKF